MTQGASNWARYSVLSDKVSLETNAKNWSVDKVASFVNDLLFGNKNVDENKDTIANRFKEEVLNSL